MYRRQWTGVPLTRNTKGLFDMCECGCASDYDRLFLQGPGNTFYMLEFGPGCHECDTPAGVIIGQHELNARPELGREFFDELPVIGTRKELAVGVASPGSIADLCVKEICDAFGVKDVLDFPESFAFDADEFKLQVYRHVAKTLADSVARFPKRAEELCNCNPEEQTGKCHRGGCPAYEPECTCYESGSHAGHEPGCYFYATSER